MKADPIIHGADAASELRVTLCELEILDGGQSGFLPGGFPESVGPLRIEERSGNSSTGRSTSCGRKNRAKPQRQVYTYQVLNVFFIEDGNNI